MDFGVAGHKHNFIIALVGVVVREVFVGFKIQPKSFFSIEGFAGGLDGTSQELFLYDKQAVGFSHVINGIAQLDAFLFFEGFLDDFDSF